MFHMVKRKVDYLVEYVFLTGRIIILTNARIIAM